MQQVRGLIDRLAKSQAPVFINGESGSGKELAARMIHLKGPRAEQPFVAVTCGARPEALAEAELFGHESGALGPGRLSRTGRVEASNHGTLFLDEVDSMAMPVQAKLLRVLEEREVMPIGADTPRMVNLRVIAASKSDLHSAVEADRFREDLYYRLNVVRLRIPPLRERRQDVPQLFAHFVDDALEHIGRSSFRMNDNIRRRLVEHDWPGNVRELKNFAFSAVLGMGNAAEAAPSEPSPPLPARVERFEASLIRDALETTAGDIRLTVEKLGIPRKTLYDKLSRYGIVPDQFRTRSRGS
jgi:two-component system C4-dicarboxylate transport response regulator DctD